MEERRLTIGEHLEELRRHVLRALIYVFAAAGVCLVFQESLMTVVIWPHARVAREIAREARLRGERSIVDILREAVRNQERLDLGVGAFDDVDRKAAERLLDEQRELLAEVPDASPEKREALKARVAELRARTEALARTVAPIPEPPEPTRLDGDADPLPEISPQLQFLGYQDAFLAYLKVALICALFFASPLVAFEIWRFIAEGLYSAERRWVHIFAPLTFGCFIAGVLFGYFILLPASLRYLATYGSTALVVPTITLDEYLGLFLALTLLIGLVFELPLVLIFLSLIGMVSSGALRGFRRYFLLIAIIIAALITPTGDPWTLGLVTLPLLGLYELGILGVRAVERAGARREAAPAA